MAKSTKGKAPRRARRNISAGRAYVHASYNNTIVTIIGYKGSKKGTPYAAQLAAADAVKKAQTSFGMSAVDVIVRGSGSGREQAIRAIQASGIEVKSIMDDSPVPHNGCRPKKKFRA
jgi:small subunit ribosomal protein S11